MSGELMFTKRHYEAVAKTLHGRYNDLREGTHFDQRERMTRMAEVGRLTDLIGDMFAEDNEYFSTHKFQRVVFAFRTDENV